LAAESRSPLLCRWNAYLNRIAGSFSALAASRIRSWGKSLANYAALPSIWELVNGTMIVWGTTRLALLPSETLDLGIKGATRMGGYPGWLQIITWQCKSIQIPDPDTQPTCN